MGKTVKFCPICGSENIEVEYWTGHEVRQGFRVQCECGSIPFIEWPDEDHEDGCECELHNCVVCGETTHNPDQVCDNKECISENSGGAS